mgnify:CR=1 FL=1
MNKKTKNIVITVLMAALFVGFFAWNIAKEQTEFSDSERRALATFPKITFEDVVSGEFMKKFEDFTLDQFPVRDGFRSVKAFFSRYVFLNKDNNDVIIEGNHISKLEYPLKEDMLSHAAERFNFIYDKFIRESGANVYFSVVPDKNMFIAEKGGYLALDYAELVSSMREKMGFAEYIDIIPILSEEDYYFTDSHWRQENITDVASHIATSMGAVFSDEFTVNTVETPFYGTYYGQAALPVAPDTMKYLTNPAIDFCTVKSYETGKPVEVPVYNMENAKGKDPYEMFLSGNQALLTVENKLSSNGKELVIFRDSFGSSLTPLLIQSYSKITVVDIRYINSAVIGNMVGFEDADVLFIYSSLLLNNSLGLK